MENNEIMNCENVEVLDGNIVADGGSSIGTGVAMLIGAGLACAIGASIKLAKKAIAAHRAKKELRMADGNRNIDDSDLEEICD